MEYRVDDLARLAGTTVRNVRVYQDRGLLPPPRREGRVGVYTDAHLSRLRLIGQLLERGFTFGHISEFIEAWQRGHELSDVLGLEEVITGPWSDEIPDYVTVAQLIAMFGDQVTPETTARSVELGFLIVEGDRFQVPSPQLLAAGAELVAAGVPLSAVLELSAHMSKALDTVAQRIVATVSDALVDDTAIAALTDPDSLTELAGVIRRLRPLAQMTVDAFLARAMERRVRESFGAKVAAAVEAAATKAPTG